MVRWLSLSVPLALGLLFAGVISMAIPSVPTATLTRESALQAWEEVQGSDPQVTRFEKIGDRLYSFATDRFPYDGDLQVVNVAIDDLGMDSGASGVNHFAIVEVDFVEMSDEIHRRHIQSIGLWERNNTLYYDHDTDRWVAFSEWQRNLVADASTPKWYSCTSLGNWSWMLPLLLVALTVLLVAVSRKANLQIERTMSAQDRILEDHSQAVKRQEEAIQLTKEALASNRQTNELLGEILGELRRSA